jgi:hypothetical protein
MLIPVLPREPEGDGLDGDYRRGRVPRNGVGIDYPTSLNPQLAIDDALDIPGAHSAHKDNRAALCSLVATSRETAG